MGRPTLPSSELDDVHQLTRMVDHPLNPRGDEVGTTQPPGDAAEGDPRRVRGAQVDERVTNEQSSLA